MDNFDINSYNYTLDKNETVINLNKDFVGVLKNEDNLVIDYSQITADTDFYNTNYNFPLMYQMGDEKMEYRTEYKQEVLDILNKVEQADHTELTDREACILFHYQRHMNDPEYQFVKDVREQK